MKKQILSVLSLGLDTVLPARCVVTGETVERQGMIASSAWASLDFIASPFCQCCGFPFDFEVEGMALCGQCLEETPPYESARAALKYNDASRSMILGFKHGDQTHAVKAFTPWMIRAGAEMLSDADVIMPVPLHYFRLISRRYNQSGIIARALAKQTGKPVLLDGLMRIRPTPPQGRLKAKDRFANVKKAFAVNARHAEKIQGKTCILIDDVYTTGATVRECAKVLKKAGAAKVHVLTLARVVKEGF
jgi:ComF family protein